ncbi:hypothetical protein BCR34DRAFT_646751 [Clohesyomyces aquaticus]|uniref:Uncharacterized protein n=1 Tax=Clohesyomyces aquaticus TaxID=1231657 RepID=A0A1Y1ZVR3_9PLEO|nr:hypothetical protein BCR34DRAFT_646751 [Clohesyomyces aquaticus]
MASFGRLTAAVLGAAQENTLALANINFDFAIMKFDAPAEYKGLGESLSKRRKAAAEDGGLHKVARKLGALFESEIPEVPYLIKAYGTRASEIAKLPRINPSQSAAYGAFSDYVGADGTTIWASATSGKGVVTVHLLACMLARIWPRQEAISIWSELVEQRKEVLQKKTLESSFQVADAVASRIELHRSQLADWDASARAWLKTADDAQRSRQTQLRLILDNISAPVSHSSNVHSAVMEAWKKALRAMNDLVSGKGLRIQSGDVLLGLSAWHLYPDISVQSPRPCFVSQGDTLISMGGIAAVGLVGQAERPTDDGFYWSLPLSHLKHYSDPVQTTRHSGLSESDVSYDQFLLVILGSNWTYLWGSLLILSTPRRPMIPARKRAGLIRIYLGSPFSPEQRELSAKLLVRPKNNIAG